ncbi:PLC-like phosphodiesterase [Thelonectria olida]|uniref:PLC-like phosphodiesterase n=1 Tax=Thelonectria olida TaxID=1576542 RepID=A0A9P8WHY7_9HYPO|nr:PLC-like phosphodiesterase [Thelonectria olida]
MRCVWLDPHPSSTTSLAGCTTRYFRPRLYSYSYEHQQRKRTIMTAAADESQPLIKHGDIPKAPWANALPSLRNESRRLPQAIAHRGAKASWPENTMAAFQGAVGVGAHALETDVHLSADGVVVLSHDPSLKRCYGVDKKIKDCDWDYLKTLRTVREPNEPMPRLRDLLQWLAIPRMQKIWVVLDIKINDDPEQLLGAIAKVLDDVQGLVPWNQRIVLGCWNATFLQTARRLLPTYPLAHISASLLYSHHFLRVPNLGFNINQKSLLGFLGWLFLREIRRQDKLLLTWTVNEPRWMEWCIRQNLGSPRKGCGEKDDEDAALSATVLIDGVITDDPKLYLQVCERFEDELDGRRVRPETGIVGSVKDTVSAMWTTVMFQFLVMGYYIVRRAQGHFDYLEDRRTLDA